MRLLLENLMDSARPRADYADVRFVCAAQEHIATRNGSLDSAERSDEEGLGVRVRVGGGWGFAATRRTDRAGGEEALARALAIASAQPRAEAGPLATQAPSRGDWTSSAEEDPFAVSLEQKLERLLAVDAALRCDPRISLAAAHFTALREHKLFASTEGALCEQRTTDCGGGISATAIGPHESQVRSYPASHDGNAWRAGYERFRELGLERAAPRVAEEAVALLSAPVCPSGRSTLILDGGQLALQVHESVGHALELDRILGGEASYAGTSFVSPEDLGRLRYGSDLMTVTADATTPEALGSFGWDDEGVPAGAEPLVEQGVLRGFLSSRESAAAIGQEHSRGCMRARGFDRQPVVRMTNVNLAPGDAGTLADLVSATERGIYMETNRSWSIDSRRLRFQFATEAAWEIVDGARGRLLKNPSYAGVTPRFWAGLDAICSPSEWRIWSLLNCGKGEPGQLMRVSHGTAPARFRDVAIGMA